MTGSAAPRRAEELFAFLDELGIQNTTVDHQAVFTVDEAKRLRGKLPGAHSKSLFLRNKKGAMWLVVALEDRPIDLKELGDRLEAGRLSFGSPERLERALGVIPGAVTPFAVLNDPEHAVQVVLDGEMLAWDQLNFHPLVNTKTTAVSADGLLAFLAATGHEPVVLDF